jgi:hypothetical protein
MYLVEFFPNAFIVMCVKRLGHSLWVNEAGRLWILYGRQMLEKMSCYKTTFNVIKLTLLMSLEHIGMAFLEETLLLKVNACNRHKCKSFGNYKMNLVVTDTDINHKCSKAPQQMTRNEHVWIKIFSKNGTIKSLENHCSFVRDTSRVFRTSMLNAEYKN